LRPPRHIELSGYGEVSNRRHAGAYLPSVSDQRSATLRPPRHIYFILSALLHLSALSGSRPLSDTSIYNHDRATPDFYIPNLPCTLGMPIYPITLCPSFISMVMDASRWIHLQENGFPCPFSLPLPCKRPLVRLVLLCSQPDTFPIQRNPAGRKFIVGVMDHPLVSISPLDFDFPYRRFGIQGTPNPPPSPPPLIYLLYLNKSILS